MYIEGDAKLFIPHLVHYLIIEYSNRRDQSAGKQRSDFVIIIQATV